MISKTLCFRSRTAEVQAENLDWRTQDRMPGVPRSSLVEWEWGGSKDKKEGRKALSTEEEFRTHGVATKDLCNNLIMLFFHALFLWIILAEILTLMLFLLPIIFVEDHEDIENIVLEVGIENYEDVENGEFESESESEYESEYDEEE